MADMKIENIIAYAQIADNLDIMKLSESSTDFKYNPDEFNGLTLKFDFPKTAILILTTGKAICTGATNMNEVETSFKRLINKIKNVGLEIKAKPIIETQNVIVSTDLEKDLNLSSISKGLLLENVSYEPDKFPGLIYKIDDFGAILVLFSSGKIVCTGGKNMDNASKAIKMMKVKLSSLGAI
jgi:transcription initiation factor TFIID TATA-box-binding protein